MFNAVLLQMTHPQNAAGKYRPQFLFLELPLLQNPLIDLVVQSALGELKQRIDLVKGHTVLVLLVADDFHQRTHMPCVTKLLHLHSELALGFSKRLLIVAADLP